MTRDEQKKLLIVQGVVHRLEIAHSLDQLKSHTKPTALFSKLPSLMKLIMASNVVPLISTLLPLVFGQSKVSRVVRRVMVMVGAGAALRAFIQRWKSSRSESRS
jgi:hypothetical protein